MAAMNGKERVLTALMHEEPDRVPLIIGQTNATGIKMKPYRELKGLLGIEGAERYIYDWPELGTALPEEAVLERLGSDARSVLDAFPSWVREKARSRAPHSPFLDDWGTGNLEIEEGKWYPGIHPMSSMCRPEDIEAYPWPDMDDPSRVSHVRAEAAALASEGRYAILGCPWLLFPFERAMAMQGMERFLENMLLEQDFAQALLWKIEGLCKTLMGHFLDECGGSIDIIKIGDDLGAQENLMISPASYRETLKPVHADLIAFIKSRTDAKVFFHSDGDIFDLVPDLVEIGVDILNPIQSGAGRMSNLGLLKKTYGKELCFCGAIDTQDILPHGSPGQVRAEVRRVMGIMGGGGGYILSAVHTVMDEVPARNILAMCDAVREFGSYPLG